MKRKIVCSVVYIFISCSMFSTNIELKTIMDSLTNFLDQTEPFQKSFAQKGLQNWFIEDIRANKSIEEGINGIFLFYTMANHQNLHFVLIDDTGFEIINMRESFAGNLEKFIAYFQRNSYYTKDDILFYISDFIRVYRRNEKKNSYKGPVL